MDRYEQFGENVGSTEGTKKARTAMDINPVAIAATIVFNVKSRVAKPLKKRKMEVIRNRGSQSTMVLHAG